MKRIYLLLSFIFPVLLLVLCDNTMAQGQLSHWWFGPKVEINWDCVTNNSSGSFNINNDNNPTKTLGGEFTMSDKRTGDFLFHIQPGDWGPDVQGGIYDNTNTYMQLSTGGPAEINLKRGHSMVIPVSQNIYYVFYHCEDVVTGIRDFYSIVDISLPGNGTAVNPSGEVTSHLVPLGFSVGGAVRHANGTDYWMVNRTSSTTVTARQISLLGLFGAPITSPVNFRPSGVSSVVPLGGLAFSPDASKMAWGFGIADFDPATGIFSNDFFISNNPEIGSVFSHNCKYLYKGAQTKWPNQFGVLTRYEVSALSATSIPVPDTLAMSTYKAQWVGFRIHYDGNIYFKDRSNGNINVIENSGTANPTVTVGAITFNPAITWSGGTGAYISSMAVEVAAKSISDTLTYNNFCDSANYDFVGESCGLVTSYHWDFGDGGVSLDQNPSYSYSASGNYTVRLMVVNDSTCSVWNTDTITTLVKVDLPCVPCDSIITPIGPICENADSIILKADTVGGTWSGRGVINSANGVFDPSIAGAGSHTVVYTLTSCKDTMVITVDSAADASFNYASALVCDTVFSVFPVGIVTSGGTFSIDNGGVINSTTGELDVLSSGSGMYNVSHVVNGLCPDTVTFNIDIVSCISPVALFSISDSLICKGECVVFTDLSVGATSWEWTFNGGTPSLERKPGPHAVCFEGVGTYMITLVVSNSFGSDTISSVIEVSANPTIDAGNDLTIKLGESTTLTAIGSDGVYTWTPPEWLDCPTCISSLSIPKETVTYSVTVVDSNGCVASDDMTILVDYDIVIFVPNIFSPNGDGNNDVLYVRGLGVESLFFVVYNRWGEKVFETKSLDIGWDGEFRGRSMNSTVFKYYLQATFEDGTTSEQEGDITLVR